MTNETLLPTRAATIGKIPMIDPDPHTSLAAIREAESRLASRAHWSFGRHAAFGALMGGLVGSYALPNDLPLAGLAVCLLAAGVVVWRDRRRDGLFINGYRAGRTRAATLFVLFVTLAALGLASFARYSLNLWWPPLLLGAAVAVVATLGSRRWERAYRAELRGQRP